MVNADESGGPNREWQRLARETGFIPIPGPSAFITSLTPEQRKTLISMDGMHPSDEGNQRYGMIAGDEIAALGLPLLQGR